MKSQVKREFFALTVVLAIFIAFPVSLFGYQALRSHPAGVRVIDLVGSSPANGGWQPDTIRVNVGERVLLRISSRDVVHGLAVPELGVQVDEIYPGHVEEVEFTPTRVGRFPFACTRWCSVDHWRMRGVIEVVDPANPAALAWTPAAPPPYQELKIDIDAPHEAKYVPASRPSAARGAALALAMADLTKDDYRRVSPSDLFSRLRANTAFQSYTDQQLWDAIAFGYRQAVGEDGIVRGQRLYSRDCAACHGEGGRGDGPAGLNLPGLAAMQRDGPGAHSSMPMKRGPADFTDASQMLGASDALLQGKILRGGMGTGMPEWGSLYTDQNMWDVISFIRSFVFDLK